VLSPLWGFIAVMVNIIAEKTSRMTLSTVRAGKAVVRQRMAREPQPPMRK
jgi:hypothetical protein